MGSIKKCCGKENIIINEEEIMISNIFSILNQSINKSNNIDKENLLILINGVDLSISGTDQKIKSGDTVTIANLVHGG
ncbi:MAG: MoaD/ThiS family protein [Thaumarchaeota archaeon]|nr:MAG: MoaD/ThiS family protein [Nitrososphaerota archaeon]